MEKMTVERPQSPYVPEASWQYIGTITVHGTVRPVCVVVQDPMTRVVMQYPLKEENYRNATEVFGKLIRGRKSIVIVNERGIYTRCQYRQHDMSDVVHWQAFKRALFGIDTGQQVAPPAESKNSSITSCGKQSTPIKVYVSAPWPEKDVIQLLSLFCRT